MCQKQNKTVPLVNGQLSPMHVQDTVNQSQQKMLSLHENSESKSPFLQPLQMLEQLTIFGMVLPRKAGLLLYAGSSLYTRCLLGSGREARNLVVQLVLQLRIHVAHAVCAVIPVYRKQQQYLPLIAMYNPGRKAQPVQADVQKASQMVRCVGLP